MSKRNILAMVAIGCMIAAQSPAEAQTAPPACSAEMHDDFDFWVGEWNVYGPDDGPYLGHNAITKINGDCLIQEHWTGASGAVGDSMNFYDPFIDAWRQVWVSGGWFIDYTGGLNEGGAMVLTGQAYTASTDQLAEFRGTWTAQEDGSVSQFFEQKDADGVWQPAFLGIYVRVDSDPRAAEAAAARGE